ncbi:hypothetical protein SBF1_880013 [Candidatus Desulfosporosinus infrequens]|uniref:Uncharacterized protein n=1 Tax=Candidatus Desulfosporosinus infrequens TaxID=2043169 RepID=A0A2U3LVL9_9FIRM|nr:hypothetical protein SBF1_880013 [Candidatus Desulfosporosinus infrequens]
MLLVTLSDWYKDKQKALYKYLLFTNFLDFTMKLKRKNS